MQARLDKKLTQAQVAQLINEKPNVIQVRTEGSSLTRLLARLHKKGEFQLLPSDVHCLLENIEKEPCFSKELVLYLHFLSR